MDNYLKVRRLQLGLTLKEIAAKVGVSEATVSRWESGQIANMKRQYIAAYAAALQTTPSFIMTGKEEDKAPQPTLIPPGFQPMPEMPTVPIVGRIACGTPILAEQNIEGSACVPIPLLRPRENPAWMLEKPSVHAGFLCVWVCLAGACKCLLLRRYDSKKS